MEYIILTAVALGAAAFIAGFNMGTKNENAARAVIKKHRKMPMNNETERLNRQSRNFIYYSGEETFEKEGK